MTATSDAPDPLRALRAQLETGFAKQVSCDDWARITIGWAMRVLIPRPLPCEGSALPLS